MNIHLIKSSVLLVGAAFALSAATADTRETPYDHINAAAAADPVVDQPVRGAVHMLSGSGGNIGLLADRDGLLLVDAGIAVSQAKIERALANLSPGPVKYVINTHWHWDHTDGNGWLRATGASIIADRHTLMRLASTEAVPEWQHTFTPVSPASRPNIVLSASRTMDFAGERVVIRHYDPGHTDGDMSVFFEKANVLATGDTFWNGMYPFIDYGAGGGIDGAIRSANANLTLARPDTLIIPGHGPLGSYAQLRAFRDMLVTVRGKVAALKAQGLSVEAVVAAKPTADLDPVWGRSIVDGALFTRLVYQGV